MFSAVKTVLAQPASADWPFDMKAGISGPHVGGNMDGKAHHGGRENRQLRMSFAVTEVYTNALLRVSRAGAVIGRSGGAGWSNQNSAGRLVRISGCYVSLSPPVIQVMASGDRLLWTAGSRVDFFQDN